MHAGQARVPEVLQAAIRWSSAAESLPLKGVRTLTRHHITETLLDLRVDSLASPQQHNKKQDNSKDPSHHLNSIILHLNSLL